MNLTDDNSPVAVMMRPSAVNTLLLQLGSMAEGYELAGAVFTARSLRDSIHEITVGLRQPAGIDEQDMLDALGYESVNGLTREEEAREAGYRE
jgi:hypothetical protein